MSSQHTVIYDAEAAAKSGRACGDCQLCCKLLPVRAVDKPGFTRCQHQHVGKGCAVYRTALPIECQLWSCRWLTGADTGDLRRPDRSHYVVDIMPDMIRRTVDGVSDEIMVCQVWLDPGFPLAHRDPALRAFVALIAERDNLPTIVRSAGGKAILLVAPSMATDDQWHEHSMTCSAEESNRFVNMLTGGEA